MTRKKFDRLCRALSYTMATAHGLRQDGKLLRNLAKKDHKKIVQEFGSYKACWAYWKPVRDAYGMK